MEVEELTRGSPQVMARISKDRLLAFREELIQLYRNFEGDVEALCKKHEVEVNYWYSPSMIPQPKFVIDGVGLNADELFEEEFVFPIELNKAKRGKKRERFKNHKLKRFVNFKNLEAKEIL